MDIAKWAGAVPTLLGFGLALGANPAIYGAVANFLARGKGVLLRLGVLILGLYTGATILFFAFRTFDPTKFVDKTKADLDAALVNRTVDYIAAAVFAVLAVSFLVWLRRNPERPQAHKPKKKKKKSKKGKSKSSIFGYYTVGLVGSTIGFTTLPIMYLVGRVVSGVSKDFPLQMAAYAVFLIALAAPFALMSFAWLHMPKLAGKVTAGYARLLSLEYRGALAALFAIAALVFLGLALFYPHHTS